MLHQKDNVPGGPGGPGGVVVCPALYLYSTDCTDCLYVRCTTFVCMYVLYVVCTVWVVCHACSVCHVLVLNTVRMTVRMVVCIDGGFVSRRIWMYPFKYCIVPVLNVSGRER